ncbi:MAG TPA: hypothetical protein VEA38_04890 [Terriglobales bacterium]|nr:hypothetical protein [Terriglobales bacterium]
MNPWKLTSIALVLVMATAVVTGIVVANWSGKPAEAPVAEVAPAPNAKRVAAAAASPSASPRVAQPAPAPAAAPAPVKPAMPSQADIDACNRVAAGAPTTGDKTVEIVKDAAIGAVIGAAVGAAGGAIADGGSGAGKGAMIGGAVGTGGGILYGVNENRKSDERYRQAYAQCMRSRGH